MTDLLDEPGTTFIPATADGKPPHDDIDVSSKQFWALTSEEREATFARLRTERPVSWQRPVEDAVTPDPDDPGYWAVTRHADIVTVSRDNDTYISGQGVLFDLLPDIFLEMSQSFLAMDPPKHDKLRRLVSAAFTPKQVRRIEATIVAAAARIVDDVVAALAVRDEIEFVDECSGRLPLQVFGDIFGVPEELRETVGRAAADVVAWADPETLAGRPADEVQVEACVTLHDIAEAMIAQRRANPTDDLMTALVEAEVDGQQLDDFEIGAFFVLMSVAGTDTTKHTTSHTVLAMTSHPEQRAWLAADFDARIGVAMDEFIRFASPVMTFRRTAVRETELGGQRIRPGDKVVMFYPSGSFDETVFDAPGQFRLDRSPNPHLGFGGGGTHYCLGNQLAKSMLRALFRELLVRLPDFEATDPVYLGTNFMRGVKRLRLRGTSAGTVTS